MNSQYGQIEDEMFDMMEKESGSIVKHYEEQISFLLSLEPQKIQSLTDTINNYGVNLSINKLADITGLSATMGTAHLFRNALVSLAHYLAEHDEELIRNFEDSKFGKDGLAKIKAIFEKLNRKAMDGFNLRFYVNMIDPEYTLTSLSSDTVLHEIDDENRKTVGYLPIIRVRLEVYDHYNDETKTHKIDFQMEDCDAFIKGLQNMRNHFVESSKTYKEKLGDNVIVTED